MARPADITHLDVVLTAGCNLRCSYCYQNDKKARRMNWDTLRASADLVLSSQRDEVSLLFIGGEPLMEFPLIERAVAYIEERRAPQQKIRYQVITNGTLLTDEHVDFFSEHEFEVQLSFDGVEPAQNFRGRGTFARLDALLDRLRAEKPLFYAENLSVSLTLVISTVSYLADSIDYFLDKRIGEIAISPSVTFEPGWRPESIDELDGQFGRMFIRLVDLYERTGEVPLVLFRRHQDPSPHKPDGLSMCGVGHGETPAVDVDGQMHGCVMFVDSYQVFPTTFLRSRLEAMRMGHISDPQLPNRMAAFPAATRAAGIFHSRQEKYSSYGRCRDCRFMTTCAICPMSIGYQPGNTDPHRIPDFLCAYNLVSLKYREKFPRQPDVREILMGHAKIPRLMQELGMFADTDVG